MHRTLQALLAQQPKPDRDITELLLYSGAFIVAIVIIAAIFMAVRAHYARSADSTQSTPFTLADLRKLHQSGQLTDEEYEKAKLAMIGHTRTATNARTGTTTATSTPQNPTNDDQHPQ